MRITYDDISPFTGNRVVMCENDPDKRDVMKLCMETGYHTYELNWKEGSDVIDIVEKSFPKRIIDSKKITEDGNIWYKLILITPFVMLMPDVTKSGDDCWCIFTLKDGNPDEDDIVMVVDSVDGDPLYRAIDHDTKKEFPNDKFELAFDAFQTIGSTVYGKIFEMSNMTDDDE